jgi:adhesin transport system membrane fusion protein
MTPEGIFEDIRNWFAGLAEPGAIHVLPASAWLWALVVVLLVVALFLLRRAWSRGSAARAGQLAHAGAAEKIRNWGDADFVSAIHAETVYGRHRRVSILFFCIVAFFVVMLVWADIAVLDEVTTGQGKVIPSSQVQVVQNLEGGIVKELLVSEGQIVEKDQILLRIDDTGFASSVGETQARQDALMAAIARLTAETLDKPLTFGDGLVERAPEQVRAEQDLYRLRKSELDSQLAVIQQQVNQRRQEVAELKSRLGQVTRGYELAAEELRLTRPLIQEGAISKVEVLRLEREVNDLKGDLESTRLALPRAQSALSEARRRISERKAAFKAEAQKELNERKASLSVVTETMSAAQDRVTRTDVRSPVRGTVKRLRVTTIGGVVRPGMDLVEIVPLDDTLVVEAEIRPTDIAFLRPGQQTMIKITAYDFSIYGGLKGRLKKISADTITNEQGDSYYQIEVEADQSFLGTDNEPLPIIPGMTASVDILTGQKTVLDYLLKPILKVRDRAMRER